VRCCLLDLRCVIQIEFYEIYKNVDTSDLLCIIKFGAALNGHPGVVHGGITALLFDNTFGWLFFARSIPVGVTANLNINYRAPVLYRKNCLLCCS
jgi:acyl-coenzyme A thioesterase PaaI-like protein